MQRALRSKLAKRSVRRATPAPPPSLAQGSADRLLATYGLSAADAPAGFVDALAPGKPLEQAVTEYLRSRPAGMVARTRMLCEALLRNPDTTTAGELGYAMLSRLLGAPEKAWYHFGRVPDEQWRAWAPVEYLRTARLIGDSELVTAATSLIADRPEDVPVEAWLSAAEGAFGYGHEDLARKALAAAAASVGPTAEPRPSTAARIRWLEDWLDRTERRGHRDDGAPSGQVAFGVLDYKQPDRTRTSSSLDDYLQTLAALAQLARHRGIQLAGPPELVRFTKALGARVDAAAAVDRNTGSVRLVPVDRDASSFGSLPEPTWLLAVGEYLEPWFGNSDFPLHPSIRPLFISFQWRDPATLTPDAIEYLRRYGPVGCSDWGTVYLLHGAGVPAFYSGYVTSTLGNLASRSGPRSASTRTVAFLGGSTTSGPKQVHVPLTRNQLRNAPLVKNLQQTVRVLDDVRDKYARVVTTDVHWFLAARSMGTRASSLARNDVAVRVDGARELDDAAFAEMRAGLDDKIASTLSLVLAGATEDEVYDHWRTICGRDVEDAHGRIRDVAPLPPPSLDVRTVCERIRSERVDVPGPRDLECQAVDVTVALDGNLKRQLGVVIDALVANSSRPLHMWVLCRDHGADDFDRMGRAFPEVTFTWLPCDHVNYGHVRGLLSYTTQATLDRLLLPDLLGELGRVVYIDLDVLPLGDIAELADWDLDGAPFAASARVTNKSGWANLMKVAGRKGRRRIQTDYLLRWLASHHTFDFSSINAGVMVLDLAVMRRDDFSRNFVPFVEIYGMNDQMVLNLYGGSRHAVLPPEWNYRPSHLQLDSPKLIHWAGRMKPWDQPLAPLVDRWREYEDALEARMASADRQPVP